MEEASRAMGSSSAMRDDLDTMSEREARAILAEEIDRLRELTYADLRAIKTPRARSVSGASGSTYSLEVETFWDDPRKKTNLRIRASICESRGRRIHRPLLQDFIKAPDESFVGEGGSQ
jgi:hypothetical protein